MLDKKDLNLIKNLVKTELKPVKQDLGKIRRDISTLVGFFDSEIVDLRERLDRVEEILNLKPLGSHQ